MYGYMSLQWHKVNVSNFLKATDFRLIEKNQMNKSRISLETK